MDNPWTNLETRPDWMTDDIKKALEHYKFPLNKDGMLMLHQKAKSQLIFWKETEMEYRKVCVAFLVPEPQKHEGMNTVELGNGFQAKVQVKLNYNLDSDNDKVWDGLDKIKALGNQGPFIADRLVSWTPNFLLTEYRQLQEDAEKGSEFAKNALKIIESFLTITEAAPTLDIKEPKKKGK
jgi:hypothetical protein